MFDPNQLLDAQFTEANDTKTIPIPQGEYTAYAEEVKLVPWQSKTDPTNSGLKLQIVWSIDDSAVKELLGRDKVTSRQDIMLDMTETGQLDMGKGRNVGLGRLREALNLNTAGRPFAFTQIPGNAAKVLIAHRVVDDNTYAEVKGVARL